MATLKLIKAPTNRDKVREAIKTARVATQFGVCEQLGWDYQKHGNHRLGRLVDEINEKYFDEDGTITGNQDYEDGGFDELPESEKLIGFHSIEGVSVKVYVWQGPR